jgi:hypothetical protein
VAAVYTISGCVLGNLFVKIVNQMQATAASPIDVIQSNSLSALAQWSVSGLSFSHLVFWFVAHGSHCPDSLYHNYRSLPPSG